MKEVPQIEAIKYALRQSKDGVIVSFVIHPNDIQPEMMALPIGSRVMFGWYEIRDDEKPVASAANTKTPARGVPTPEPPQVPKPKHERSLAERCAILCGDARFRDFLRETTGFLIRTPEDADRAIKANLHIESKTELNEYENGGRRNPNFNAEAAANLKLLIATYDAHRADKDYADVRR